MIREQFWRGNADVPLIVAEHVLIVARQCLHTHLLVALHRAVLRLPRYGDGKCCRWSRSGDALDTAEGPGHWIAAR